MTLSGILNLLGSLGLFLVGMKIMSDALMGLAGDQMRQFMAGLTSNRFSAALTGFFVTGLIQSSSATTLMVVSFVNAGLLKLTEAIGVIMGANIGTTITAWLIAVLGFKVSMIDLSLPLMFVGFLLFIRTDKRTATFGQFVIGFSLLFIGLEFMKNAVPDLQSDPAVFEFIQNVSGYGFLSIIIFAALGSFLTLVLQSSSATMAITLIAVSQGWLPFEAGCAIVLGENIGTTVTANLAAAVSGRNARRTALAHLAFNLFGVTWVLILFSPFVEFTAWISSLLQGASPVTNPADAPIGLAVFHTVFNVANTTLLIGFVHPLASLVTRLLPDKPVQVPDQAKPAFLNEEALKYPETALAVTIQEAQRLYREPVYDAVLKAMNIEPDKLILKQDIPALVKQSRASLENDFSSVIHERLEPIYRELMRFITKTSQAFSLNDKQTRELLNIGQAARDSLLIVRDATQANKVINNHMNDKSENTRDAFDSLREDMLRLMMDLQSIDITLPRKQFRRDIRRLKQEIKDKDHALDLEINQLLKSNRISTEAASDLYNASALVISIANKMIRAARHIGSVNAEYEVVPPETADAA